MTFTSIINDVGLKSEHEFSLTKMQILRAESFATIRFYDIQMRT